MAFITQGLGAGSTDSELLLRGLSPAPVTGTEPAQTARSVSLAALFRAQAQTVTYSRGASSVSTSALIGLTDPYGATDTRTTLATAREFIVKRSGIESIGLPVRGDHITVSGVVYQVLPLPGDDVFSALDQRGEYLRIHTRKAAAWSEPDATTPNMVKQGLNAAFRFSGVGVTYKRGGAQLSINAMIADTSDQETSDGYQLDNDARDYLVKFAELQLSGSQAVPSRGDQIVFQGVTWQVLPIEGTAVWRPLDPGAYVIRIHTRKTTAGAFE